jgi:hypothetical protein
MIDEIRKKLSQNGTVKPTAVSRVIPHLDDIEQLKSEGFPLRNIAAHYNMNVNTFYVAVREAKKIRSEGYSASRYSGMPLQKERGNLSDTAVNHESITKPEDAKNFSEKNSREDRTARIKAMTPQERKSLFNQTSIDKFNIELEGE